MEKPELEKVIEKLEKLDIREWGISGYSFKKPILTAKTNELMFYTKIYDKFEIPFNKICYSIIIQDENQKVFIEYEEEDTKKGKMGKFYENLCKNFEKFNEDELIRRTQDFICGSDPEKKDIERIIEKLETIDSKEWEADLNFKEKNHKPKYPDFILKLYGLRLVLKRKLLGSYVLEIKGPEGDAKQTYALFEGIKHLYEKLYKELEHKEKSFKEKLDALLSD